MRARAWLAAGLFFICGLAVGSIVTIRIGQRMLRNAFSAPADAPSPLDRRARRIEGQLKRALDLSPAQAAQVDAAIDQTTREIKVLRVDTGQRLQEVLNRGIAAAAAPLTPGQKARFYALARTRLEALGLAFNPPANP